MAKLEIYAEVGGDGGCLLYTFDPPGLLARGVSLEQALAAAPAETGLLREFLTACGRLDQLKEVWGEDEFPDLEIRQTVKRQGKVANGGTRATFEGDLVPIGAEEIPAYLALMAHMRSTLRTLKDRLPREALRFKSRPGRMPIGEQLRHISYCECWYLSQFWSDVPSLPRVADPWDKLTQCRELVIERMSSLLPEELAAIRKSDGETWTVRKLFRRFLYHERFHRDTIARDIELFLAGVQGAKP
jgi:hypothetical protein